MIAQPPPSPTGVSRKLDVVELRMANLRRELESKPGGPVRAAILYHMGTMFEHELGQVDEAVAHYARALEEAPEFEPAAIARMRIAERSASNDHIVALCETQLAAAGRPATRASGLVDLALRSDDAVGVLREAIDASPDALGPTLLLEWKGGAAGDADAVRDAVRAQAERTSDPTLRAALWLDLALAEIDGGDIDASLQALELCCECDALAWPARVLQRRTAKAHERWEAAVDAALGLAELLQRPSAPDPLELSVPDEERLPLAALLFEEAATCAACRLGDLDAAGRYLAEALRLRPDDLDLRLRALLAADARRDPEALDAAVEWFSDHAPDCPGFVAFRIRSALTDADDLRADETLLEIAHSHRTSALAQAALDVHLLRRGADEARVGRWVAHGEHASDDARAEFLWRAARSSTPGSDDANRLFAAAASAALESKTDLLRDAFGAALLARSGPSIVARAEALLERDLDPDERRWLEHCRYDATRHLIRDVERAEAILRTALDDPATHGWSAHVARGVAARAGRADLLARAHEALAARASASRVVAHQCAAGRAYARCGDWAAAERVLREALATAPADRYVLGLLQAVLREGGRPEAVVELAQERVDGGALGEDSLLLAGAAAERDGNVDAAADAYAQALAQNPGSPSAALAVADLGLRRGDIEARMRAFEHLEAIELGGGVPELLAVLRGDAMSGDARSAKSASRAYEVGLEHPRTALPAAIALLSTPIEHTSEEQRSKADDVLTEARGPSNGSDESFSAAYATLAGAMGSDASSTADAWLELSTLAPSEGLRASALLQGLREMRVHLGEQAIDDLFMVANDSAELAPTEPEAAAALDEVLAPGDDADLRAITLHHRRAHSADIGKAAIDAAYCRALVEGGRGAEAVARLSAAIDERPDDLSLWEALRAAARQAEEWPLLAQSCERLAQFVDGELQADLLEEAGSVRLDYLGQVDQAEDLFRAALDSDPGREVAFRRLRDVLADREDAEALEALVSARLALGGPKDRAELLYERARLLRGFSDRPGALEVLDELFTADPDHRGALALAAEVHVSLERWDLAVDCLRRLARSDLPAAQRRVAHLGAADFLETRLQDREGALLELRAVEALGEADADTWSRIGALEERAERIEEATHAYQQALAVASTHATAAERLSELLDGEARQAMATAYEAAIWERLDGGAVDACVQALHRAASWRGHSGRAAAIEAAARALGRHHDRKDGRDAQGAPVDLANVSIASIWDGDANAVVDAIIGAAGPGLAPPRPRAKKLGANDDVSRELERLCERFGARLGSVSVTDGAPRPQAFIDRDGSVSFVVPSKAEGGLHDQARFEAGRLAWAGAHGATALVEMRPDRMAGTLAAVLEASRCPISRGEPVLPAVAVKVRRATRRRIADIVGDTRLDTASLLSAAERLERIADRAGLLACGHIGAALAGVLDPTPSSTAVAASPRAIALLRFWMGPDSMLWSGHA